MRGDTFEFESIEMVNIVPVTILIVVVSLPINASCLCFFFFFSRVTPFLFTSQTYIHQKLGSKVQSFAFSTSFQSFKKINDRAASSFKERSVAFFEHERSHLRVWSEALDLRAAAAAEAVVVFHYTTRPGPWNWGLNFEEIRSNFVGMFFLSVVFLFFK